MTPSRPAHWPDPRIRPRLVKWWYVVGAGVGASVGASVGAGAGASVGAPIVSRGETVGICILRNCASETSKRPKAVNLRYKAKVLRYDCGWIGLLSKVRYKAINSYLIVP